MTRAYCDGLHASNYADLTLYDDAMRPLLIRLVRATGLRTRDATLAGDANTLLSARTAWLSRAELAKVPAPIRADIRAIRAEKQQILQHVVAGANGDPSGVQFILQSEANEGGVATPLQNSASFLRTHCPAADVPAALRRATP